MWRGCNSSAIFTIIFTDSASVFFGVYRGGRGARSRGSQFGALVDYKGASGSGLKGVAKLFHKDLLGRYFLKDIRGIV